MANDVVPAPIVFPLISECSKLILLQDLTPGADVAIFRDGNHLIAEGKALWSEQSFPLNPEIYLEEGNIITASQRLGTDESDKSPCPVKVGKFDPKSLNQFIFANQHYRCGKYIWLTSVIPGAKVVTNPASQNVVPDACCVRNNAALVIDPPLMRELVISLVVNIRGADIQGDWISGPEPSPIPVEILADGRQRLPKPVIDDNIYECIGKVGPSNLVVGADVTVTRATATGPETVGHIAAFSEKMPAFIPNLHAGDELTFTESMKCDVAPLSSEATKIVLPFDPALAPQVIGPICAGTPWIIVSSMFGSQVCIQVNGKQFGPLHNVYATEAKFYVRPLLKPGDLVTARCLDQCNNWSKPSKEAVKVGSLISPTLLPRISTNKLYACADVVPCEGVYPGAWLRVLSDKIGQISDWFFFPSEKGPSQPVPVTPALIEGHNITVEEFLCSAKNGTKSLPVTVSPTPSQIQPPNIGGKFISGNNQLIIIYDCLEGAVVEVYLNDTLFGSFDTGLTTLYLSMNLNAGDKLEVRQRICRKVSEFKQVSIIQAPPLPAAPVNLKPSNGSVIAKKTQYGYYILEWRDPGEATEGKATRFFVNVSINNIPLGESTVDKPRWDITEKPYSTVVDWEVSGENASGRGNPSKASFRIENDPSSPTPTPTAVLEKDFDIFRIDVTVSDTDPKIPIVLVHTLPISLPVSPPNYRDKIVGYRNNTSYNGVILNFSDEKGKLSGKRLIPGETKTPTELGLPDSSPITDMYALPEFIGWNPGYNWKVVNGALKIYYVQE